MDWDTLEACDFRSCRWSSLNVVPPFKVIPTEASVGEHSGRINAKRFILLFPTQANIASR
jgi:hypothetical protein